MNTHNLKLVSIITEAYALDAVKHLLHEIGAHGCTHYPVEGTGSRGERAGETKEFANVKIEVILQPAAAETLLERLEHDLFPRFGMIVFESDVRVIRSGKF